MATWLEQPSVTYQGRRLINHGVEWQHPSLTQIKLNPLASTSLWLENTSNLAPDISLPVWDQVEPSESATKMQKDSSH